MRNAGKTFNVMISSAGRRVALLEAFRNTLWEQGIAGKVFAIDCSPLSAAYHRAEEGFLVPRCSDPAFIPTVVEICRRESVDLVVPTIDPELSVYARHREMLEEVGTRVLVSGEATTAIGGDKKLTHEWLVDSGFPTVRQWNAESIPADVPLPVIAKPRFGSASIGVRIINTPDELTVIRGRADLIVQEMATGQEHTIDLFLDQKGRCLCAVPRRRIEVRAGEVSKAVTVRNQALEELAMAIADELPDATGVLNIQVFVDSSRDRFAIIELNPRFGGGFPLAREAGADFPRWVIEDTLGIDCGARQDSWRGGVVMLRYDEAVFVLTEKIGLGL